MGKTTPQPVHLKPIITLPPFQAVDAGGSMYVHTFGAYFGLMVSLAMRRNDNPDFSNEGAEYHSDIFAMIGVFALVLRHGIFFYHINKQ
jgi:ammonia channel protein AmtB